MKKGKKSQTNISHEYRGKILNKNKHSSALYKMKYTS